MRQDVAHVALWEESYRSLRRGRWLRRRRIARAGLPRGGRLLDLGCGDGLNLPFLEEFSGATVIGLDCSEALLAQIRGAGKVAGDGARLPFRDGSFRTVFVDSVLHHLPLDEALDEIRRVLEPGGSLCALEPRRTLARTLYDLVTESPLSHVSRFLAMRRITLEEEVDIYGAWLEIARRIPEIVEAHGFRTAGFRPLSIGVSARWVKT